MHQEVTEAACAQPNPSQSVLTLPWEKLDKKAICKRKKTFLVYHVGQSVLEEITKARHIFTKLILLISKLDGVGPIDNRPYTD